MTRLEMDPWLEGYMSYQREVKRLSHRTVVDFRCTLKRVLAFMEAKHPGTPLWRLRLEDYLHCSTRSGRGAESPESWRRT